MPERLIGAVLKTVERASVPWVRIPPSPPFKRVREGSFLVCSEKGEETKDFFLKLFWKTGKLYGIQKVIYSKLITTISGGQLKRIGKILIPIPFVSIIVLLSSKIFPVVYLFPYFDGTIIAPQMVNASVHHANVLQVLNLPPVEHLGKYLASGLGG